jgi:chromosome segregation ATPase
MDSFNESTNINTYFNNLGNYFHTRIDHYEDTLSKIQTEIVSLTEKYNIAQNQIASHLKIIGDKDNLITKLEADIKRLEDEKNAFSRVSQIIAMEKENTRLKADLEFLSTRLNKLVTKAVDDSVKDAETCTKEVVAEAVAKDAAKDEDGGEQKDDRGECGEEELHEPVYKKKIKGTLYFIGENTKRIYQIDENDKVGQHIGHLQTIFDKDKNEKLKVVWN